MEQTDGLFDFLEGASALKVEPKPWMTTGEFHLVRATNETLPKIIDDCIASGLYALDLETTGLDNRVFDGETVSKIVGCCLSPDGRHGYYIPLRHKTNIEANVSWSLWKREMQRLIASPARAIFHNGKFDQEYLQNCGGDPIGEWDDPKKWEDTLILAFLRNTSQKVHKLKALAKAELGMEMIELEELFPENKRKGGLDFSELDPTWEPVTWYGASDAICTWNLLPKFYDDVVNPNDGVKGQGLIYIIEKLCVAATRWMERARVLTDQEKAKDLIRNGQREWLDTLEAVYEGASAIVGRDIRPGYYRILRGTEKGLEKLKFDPEQVTPGYMERVEIARTAAAKARLDPQGEKKGKVSTVTKRVPSLTAKGLTEDVEFPVVYDVLAAAQLGALLRECKVPGLKVTEKSGQVATSQDDLEDVLGAAGDKFPFAKKIKRFREVSKALSTYLLPVIEDCHTDGTLKVHFRELGTETGRFSAPASKDPKVDGGTRLPFHGLPATYDTERPECLLRIREVVIARPGKFIVAIDFSGVELRIVTNLSGEPKWLREFFHCSGCDYIFPMPTQDNPVPVAPPPYCPQCGSDKIGDLHTLSGIAFFGEDAPKKPEWKKLRGDAKCVHPDTLILRDGVLQSMGSLPLGPVDTFLPVPGTVQGPTGPIPLLESYNGGIKPLFHVVTRRGIVTCTDRHRFETVGGELCSISSGLTKGVRLAAPSQPPELVNRDYLPIRVALHEDVPELTYQPTHDTSYFAGLFQGDGCKGGTRSVSIAHGEVSKTDLLGVPYVEWQQILGTSCEKVGLRPVPRATSVYLGSRNTMRFFAALGLLTYEGSRVFRIPSWVLAAGRDAGMHYLAGLWDTDGYVNKKDGCGAWLTKDIVFASQVCSLASVLGLVPRVEPCWNKTYQRFYWRIHISSGGMSVLRAFLRHPGKIARVRLPKQTPVGKPNEVLDIIPAGEGPCVDIHVGTDEHLFWCNGLVSRNSCNFALCYGGGGNAVVTSIGCDKNEGWRIKEQFDKTYHVLAQWWKNQVKYVKEHKYVVTAFYRRYHLPDIARTDPRDSGFRAKAERNAVNGPVQGTSADITKIAMGQIYKECKKRGWLDKVHMLLTIHDELVFEIDLDILEEACDLFVKLMCRNDILLRLGWPVPLTSDIEIGHDWTVPWNLHKIRHKKVCPPELDGLIKGVGVKGKEPPKGGGGNGGAKASEVPERVYKLKGLTLGEVESLARLIHDGAKTPKAKLRVIGPNDEDLTSSLSAVWGGRLPMVGEA
jgi:DNA polymerase I-like protein with 3'-5' exonuclease and polymerase domains